VLVLVLDDLVEQTFVLLSELYLVDPLLMAQRVEESYKVYKRLSPLFSSGPFLRGGDPAALSCPQLRNVDLFGRLLFFLGWCRAESPDLVDNELASLVLHDLGLRWGEVHKPVKRELCHLEEVGEGGWQQGQRVAV
jgi:hypothetical protein